MEIEYTIHTSDKAVAEEMMIGLANSGYIVGIQEERNEYHVNIYNRLVKCKQVYTDCACQQ